MKTRKGSPSFKQSQSIRRMVITAMLSAITALLAFTPIGMIMLPPPLPAVTLVHIPVIVAALIEGPWVGLPVGLVFGVCSLIRAWESGMVGLTLFFRNPLVSVLPRLMIPLTAYGAYLLWQRLTRRNSAAKQNAVVSQIGVVAASAIGALTNTVLCLGAIMLLYGGELTVLVNNLIGLGGASDAYMNQSGAWLVAAVGLPNGIAEMLVAAILVPMVKTAVDAITRRGSRTKRTVAATFPATVAADSTADAIQLTETQGAEHPSKPDWHL